MRDARGDVSDFAGPEHPCVLADDKAHSPREDDAELLRVVLVRRAGEVGEGLVHAEHGAISHDASPRHPRRKRDVGHEVTHHASRLQFQRGQALAQLRLEIADVRGRHALGGELHGPRINMTALALRAAGKRAWIVGGCVRDLLLGLRPKDFDVATNALRRIAP